MRHTQILQASGRWDVSAIGEYIHYEKGAGEVEIEVNGETHLLSIRDTFIAPEGYTGFKVLNLDASAGEFSFLTGRGQLKVAASGQLTEVSGIASTVDVNLLNPVTIESLPAVDVQSLPTVQVDQLPAVDVQSLPTVQVDQLPAVDVQSLPALDVQSLPRFKGGSTASAKKLLFDATGILTIPASATRKDLTVLALDTNANTVTFDELDLYAGDSLPFSDFIGSIQISGTQGEGVMVMEVNYAA